jgi:DNA-binding Xre family transcriptional regulator
MIIINLDVMLAKRKMSLTELSERLDSPWQTSPC